MGRKVADVIFVFSEQMINEQNAVLKTIGQKFVPGEVFVGDMPKKYTKMITNDEFDGIKSRYPDERIVVRGDRYKLHYTLPSTTMVVQD